MSQTLGAIGGFMKASDSGRSLRRLVQLAPRRSAAFLRDCAFGLPIYRYTLLGQVPRGPVVSPPDPWPGVASRGAAIVLDNFTFAGETVTGDEALWTGNASRAWLERFHAFGWIADLHLVGSDAARQRARKLVGDWIDHNERWSRIAWRGDVLGRRIAAWLGQFDFFGATGDDAFRERVLTSIAHQVRHLARSLPGDLDGAPLLSAVKGLIYAGACIPGRDNWLESGVRVLDHELPRQVRGDGGHIERSPSTHLAVLRDLVDMRAALTAAKRPVPDSLQSAIDRMAPALRFFRHGDGGLALFNDSSEEEPWLIDMVLARSDARGKPLASAPHIGFQRLQSNRTLVIMDAGAPIAIARAPDISDRAHAGTLSFEMSVGKERLIVNCGAMANPKGPWRRAQRATAAHSTLTMDDTNSAHFDDEGKLVSGPQLVANRREEAEGNVWVEASHDGYADVFGFIHKRRLFLAAGGDDLRGEDTLMPLVPLGREWAEGSGTPEAKRSFRKAGPEMSVPFAVRFHLHPQVKVSLIQNGGAALLRLPSGIGWRMRAAGARMALEPSVYLGVPGIEARRTEQIVLYGKAPPRETVRIKWALARVTEKG